MIELFEFRVDRPDEFSFLDEEVKLFVTDFLEQRGLFWGGGGDSNCMQGVVSTNGSIDLNLLIEEFIGFFKVTDKIVIRLINGSGNRPRITHSTQRQNVTFEHIMSI